MKKDDMIKGIDYTLIEMADILEESGIKFEDITPYDRHPDDWDKITLELIKPGHKWILGIKDGIYRDVLKIYELLSKETWERYKKWEVFSETREMILLQEVLIKFKKAFTSRKRPDLFKKGKFDAAIKKREKQIESSRKRARASK